MFPDDIYLHLEYDKITDELCCPIPEDIISRTQESRDDIWNIRLLNGSLGVPFTTVDERDYFEFVYQSHHAEEKRYRWRLGEEKNLIPSLEGYTREVMETVKGYRNAIDLTIEANKMYVTLKDPRITFDLSEKTQRHFSPSTVTYDAAREPVKLIYDSMAGFRRIFIVCKHIAPHVFHNGLNLGILSSNVTRTSKHFIEFPASPRFYQLNKNFPLENFSVYMVDEFGKKLNLSASHCYCMLHLQRV
jgi:hypothetical protein